MKGHDMAHCSPEITWVLELTGPELLLVSKGLTGTLKPNTGERRAAHELAVRIAEQRAKKAREMLEIAEGAQRVIGALEVPEDDAPPEPPRGPQKGTLSIKK
jgi:hypothetical protein